MAQHSPLVPRDSRALDPDDFSFFGFDDLGLWLKCRIRQVDIRGGTSGVSNRQPSPTNMSERGGRLSRLAVRLVDGAVPLLGSLGYGREPNQRRQTGRSPTSPARSWWLSEVLSALIPDGRGSGLRWRSAAPGAAEQCINITERDLDSSHPLSAERSAGCQLRCYESTLHGRAFGLRGRRCGCARAGFIGQGGYGQRGGVVPRLAIGDEVVDHPRLGHNTRQVERHLTGAMQSHFEIVAASWDLDRI